MSDRLKMKAFICLHLKFGKKLAIMDSIERGGLFFSLHLEFGTKIEILETD